MASKRWHHLLTILAVICCLLYVFLIPENHSEAEDAYWYAKDLRDADFSSLWHPYHMIYLPLMRMLFMPFRALGMDAFSFLIIANKLLGILTLLVCYRILCNRDGEFDRGAFLFVAFIGVSYGFWRYSNVPEVYMLANFFNVLLVYWLFKRPITPSNTVIAGGLGTLALLGHATGLSLVLVAVPIFFLHQKNLKALFRYGITVGLLIIILYGGVQYALSIGDPPESLFGQSSGRFSSFKLTHIPKAIFGSSQDLISGNFLFAFDGFVELIVRVFPNRMMDEEIFMGKQVDGITPVLAVISLVGAAITFFLLFFKFMKKWSWPTKKKLLTTPQVSLLIAWTAVFTLIAIQKSTGNPERWLLVMVPASLLAYHLITKSLVNQNGTHRLASGFVFFLFTANLWGGFFPILTDKGDYNAQKAYPLIESIPPGSMLLTIDNGGFNRFLDYNTQFEVINLFSNEDLDATQKKYRLFEQRIEEFPGSIYATGDVFRIPKFYYSDNPRAVPETEKLSKKLAPEFEKITDNEFGGIYQRMEGH